MTGVAQDPNPFAGPSVEDVVAPPSPTTDAERIRREHLTAETNIRSIGLLYIIGGAFGTLGAVAAVAGFVASLFRDDASDSDFALGILLLLFLMYPAILWAGIALRRFRTWARWVAVVLSVFGLLGVPIGTIVAIGFLYVLLNKKATYVFTPEYQAVIAQTPHIKYKTSPIAWAVLGLIVLGLVAALVAAALG